MNIDFLKYFVTVAEKSSIAQAANALYISRQALSKAIHRAEQELGIKLILTQGQRFTLTEEGIIFNFNKLQCDNSGHCRRGLW